jgi:hypothetical protein
MKKTKIKQFLDNDKQDFVFFNSQECFYAPALLKHRNDKLD